VYLAGIGNSGAGHWQRLWYAGDAGAVWVEQADWEHPRREAWVAAIARSLDALAEPALLIAHSLGCLAAAEYLTLHGVSKVRAAWFVAVPDVASQAFPSSAEGFRCARKLAVTVPSVVVGSRNDPYASFEHARAVAAAWQSQLYDVGSLGHINADSGLAGWPEGALRLQEFERSLLARA
jgi:predicted alpha/beta hydrolase family esterase